MEFFRERRIKPQLKWANDTEMSHLGGILMRNLDSLFEGIEAQRHHGPFPWEWSNQHLASFVPTSVPHLIISCRLESLNCSVIRRSGKIVKAAYPECAWLHHRA